MLQEISGNITVISDGANTWEMPILRTASDNVQMVIYIRWTKGKTWHNVDKTKIPNTCIYAC